MRRDQPHREKPNVVILGGGFGGLYAARALEDEDVHITLIDRKNHHLFQPLLYQVATAALNPSDIAAPIRGILRKANDVEVLLAEVESVDVANKKVILTDGEISYDFLIVSTGATHSYFGKDEWAKFAPGLKTLDDALDIRRRVLTAFELAERETDPRLREELLTFVIVGAGPTGVEMAGALAEIARQALAKDFHNIDPRSAKVILLEGLGKVLPPYPDDLSEEARQSLQSIGVEVRTGMRVTNIDERGVEVGGSERIPTRTVIWAAGVAASPIARSLGAPLDRAGRVIVTKYLTIPGHDDVFVIGDLAHFEEDGAVVPGVAPAAMQMGRAAARNIGHQLQGAPMFPFSYWDRGTFAVIGRGEAVGVAFKRFKMKGYFAWLAWLFIHVLFLIGFRNKLATLFNWAYSYVAFRRAVRLITGEPTPTLDSSRTGAAGPSRGNGRDTEPPPRTSIPQQAPMPMHASGTVPPA